LQKLSAALSSGRCGFKAMMLWLLLLWTGLTVSLKLDLDLDTLNSWVYTSKFALLNIPSSNLLQLYADTANTVSTMYGSVTDSRYDGMLLGKLNYEYGILHYNIDKIASNSKKTILIYDDYKEWESIYLSGDSCYEKSKKASIKISLSTDTRFTAPNQYYNYYDSVKETATGRIVSTSLSDTATFWFVVIANCDILQQCDNNYNCQGSIVSKGTLEYTNGKTKATQQLSYDESALVMLAIIFFVLECFLLVVALRVVRALRRSKSMHPIVGIVVLSVCSHLLSKIFLLSFFGSYSSSGYCHFGLLFAGLVFSIISVFLIIIDVILLAKGWVIVRSQLSPHGVIKIVAYGTILLYFMLVVQILVVRDYSQSVTVVKFNYPSQIALILLRVVVAPIWFTYAGYTTMKNFNKKMRFYRKFMVACLLWLLFPIIGISIQVSISVYDATFIYFFWDSFLVFIAQLVLLLMYHPNLTLSVDFPFHSVKLNVDGTPVTELDTSMYPQVNSDNMGADPNYSNVSNKTEAVGGTKVIEVASKKKQFITLSDVYSDIKGSSQSIKTSMVEVTSYLNAFIAIFDDWDVEVDDKD
jgi:hypothetical protein